MTAVEDIPRKCFEAFHAADQPAMEALLADDFTFTSPYDDHISRDTYFERCWPGAGTFKSFMVRETVCIDAICFVLYEAVAGNGKAIRNAERFEIRDGKVRSIEVFFGGATDS